MPSSSTSKAKAKAQAQAQAQAHARDRQSRSRNTTPVSASSASVLVEPKTDSSRRTTDRSTFPYLHTSLHHPASRAANISSSAVNDVFDSHSSNSPSGIPSATALSNIVDAIKGNILSIVHARDEACDQMMRELASRKKERIERDRIRDLEIAKRDAEERRQQIKKATTPKEKEKEKEKERPPAVGAHGVARQDGVDRNDTSSPISSIASHPPPSAGEATTRTEKESESDSESEPRQPRPAASVQQYQIFGDDPSAYDDPTIYDIREITPAMSEAEKKAIFGVTGYPPSDLLDLTAGIPPDRDLSNAKPSNQVAAQTFLNFAEPYLRMLTQEDLAFLGERGDRVHVFEIPKRGPRHYKEIWAEEDGNFLFDAANVNLPANEARGGSEMMADDMLETDYLSVGPVTARLLSLLRPVTRVQQEESGTNGTIKGEEMDIDNDNPLASTAPNGTQEGAAPKQQDIHTATAFPESTWKNVPFAPNQDWNKTDERIIEELKHIGFLPPNEQPTYSDVQDDEVTARLRYLQRELRRVSLVNGARKARILEIAEERMAVQEWQGISDDLDNQLNQAYLKRTRNIGKGKKQVKRPVGAPGVAHMAGVARPGGHGVGEPIRSLMERRSQWNELIGPVVAHGSVTMPKQSIFDKGSMDRLTKAEMDKWIDDGEEV